MPATNLEYELGHRVAPSPEWGHAARLDAGDPADGVRLVRLEGVLDQPGSVRLLRRVDGALDAAAPGRRDLRAMVVDLTAVEFVGPSAAHVLVHAADSCARRGVGFAVAGRPPAGSTPPVPGEERLRGYASVDEAVRAATR